MANMKTIAQNKKARHDYFVEETYEAGIELCGTEVKSLRAGRVNLKDSKVKLQVGLCKGKKLYDKRADMAERSAKRDMERAIKEQRR